MLTGHDFLDRASSCMSSAILSYILNSGACTSAAWPAHAADVTGGTTLCFRHTTHLCSQDLPGACGPMHPSGNYMLSAYLYFPTYFGISFQVAGGVGTDFT